MTKVMLVEDDETMLSLLRMLLQLENFEVVLAGQDTAQADSSLENILTIIRRELPDLVLLDVNLRQFNGFDLLRRIRQDAELSGLRILMSSGMDFGQRCYQEGADGFILKPYMPEELIKKIRDTTRE
jgi:DNA-binding response OmpR family regulator